MITYPLDYLYLYQSLIGCQYCFPPSTSWERQRALLFDMIKHINYIVELKSKLSDSDWICCQSFCAEQDAVNFIAEYESNEYDLRLVKQTITEELIQ